MGEMGSSLRFLLVAAFVPVTLMWAATLMLSEGGMADGIDGSPPPFEGDWTITEDTTVDGMDLHIRGNVTVERSTILRIEDSYLTITHGWPHLYTFHVKAGAELYVVNSTLRLDTFTSKDQAYLEFSNGSLVVTTGRFLADSDVAFASDTTFRNVAPDGGVDEPGEDATFVVDGNLNSNFRRVHIHNRGGDAGSTSPAGQGNPGGASVIVSNVTVWLSCVIESIAGNSSIGGLGLTGDDGGPGGEGGNAEVRWVTEHVETCEIEVRGSYGSTGASGSANVVGPAGDGGSGGSGGDALVNMTSEVDLRLEDVTIFVMAGPGGSGGNGGETTEGIGGNGGAGVSGGEALLQVHVMGGMELWHSNLTASGGEGGYGGDYGRATGSNGQAGFPGRGGGAGIGSVEIQVDLDLQIVDSSILGHGGSGYEGGGGYGQGETGGEGGKGQVVVRVKGELVAIDMVVEAVGCDGGDGGVAFSEILGNGGDGGDGYVGIFSLMGIELDGFSIKVLGGEGGLGNTLIWDGADGIATFDMVCSMMRLRNGLINRFLDDIGPGDEVYIYNVTQEGWGVISPLGGDVWTFSLLTVRVVDNPDVALSDPLEDCLVIVYATSTFALIEQGVTDSDGKVEFELQTYHYSKESVVYTGSYLLVIISPDNSTSKKVRVELTENTKVTVPFIVVPPVPIILVDEPEEGKEHVFNDYGDTVLEVKGEVHYTGEAIHEMRLHLYLQGDDPLVYPWVRLEIPSGPWLWVVPDPFPPARFYSPGPGDNEWTYSHYYEMIGGNITYVRGTYVLVVEVTTEYDIYTHDIHFDVDINPHLRIPVVNVTTPIDGELFDGSVVVIEGTATDDLSVDRVEVRLDGQMWETIPGAPEWSYTLDTGALEDGWHVIEFRAFDGDNWSETLEYEFTVSKPPGPIDGDDGGGEGGFELDPGLTLALVVVTVVVLIFVGMVFQRMLGRVKKDS